MATDSHTADRRTVTLAAASGVGAYVLGYVLTYVAAAGEIEQRLSLPLDLGPDVATTTVVGWLFYGMHQVQIRIAASGGGVDPSGTLSLSDLPFWEGWYVLVPPLLLLAAGVAVGTATDPPDVQTGALAGAAITVGYLPLALAGTVLFTYSQTVAGVTVTISPALGTGIVLAGVVFPTVFGAVGGGLGAVRADLTGS